MCTAEYLTFLEGRCTCGVTNRRKPVKRRIPVLRIGKVAAAFAFAFVLPVAAFAQATISGTVKDASGAVLPGVTVEASSPALIEKTRSTVTDGTGQFAIEN